jgi:calcineurin-like phosphoesterase
VRNLIICTSLLLLAACGSPDSSVGASPEDAIRDWVARGEAAAEEKDRGALLEMISEDYADGRGNDHEQIGDMLRVYFFRQQSVALLTSIDDITMMGDTAASVRLTVGMAGTRESSIGVNANAYNFEFELEKPDEDWMLIGARWSRLGRDLH